MAKKKDSKKSSNSREDRKSSKKKSSGKDKNVAESKDSDSPPKPRSKLWGAKKKRVREGEPDRMSLKKKIVVTVAVLAALTLIGSFLSLIITATGTLSGVSEKTGNVALIKINGPVSVGSERILGESVVSSTSVVEKIEKAEENSDIEAIVLDINSPGGTPVASDEIGEAVSKTEKPTVAWIRELGASGAYWIASNSDHLVANRMSITGSIGVSGSYLGFAEFIEQHNVSYNRLVSGEKKDVGSPLKKLRESDKEFLQEKLDSIRQEFVSEVSENRNLSLSEVENLATGEYFLGKEAVKNGLMDQLGGRDEVVSYLKKRNVTEVEFRSYRQKRSFWDKLVDLEVNVGFSGGKREIMLE